MARWNALEQAIARQQSLRNLKRVDEVEGGRYEEPFLKFHWPTNTRQELTTTCELSIKPTCALTDRKNRQVSFDVYLQVFENGESAGISRDGVRDAFGAAFVSEPMPDRWKVTYDAQNSCDVYLSSHGSTMLKGFSINRPCGDLRLWDALAFILTLGNVVFYFPGGEAPLVAKLDVSRHLPRDMIEALGEPIVVGSGAQILREIQSA